MFFSACQLDLSNKDKSSATEEGSREVSSEIDADNPSRAVGKIIVSSSYDQKLSAPEGSLIAGADVTFPAGSISADGEEVNMGIEQANPSLYKDVGNDVGIQSSEISSVAPGVLVWPSSSLSLQEEFSVSLPSESSSASLALFDESILAVFYSVFDQEQAKFISGSQMGERY